MQARLTGAHPSPADVSPADTTPTSRVLIVDDDPAVLNLLVRLLTKQGYTTETAVDGPSALVAAAQHPPDLVILDVIMPGMNGFELCRRLKRDPVSRLIPVIMVTGDGQHEQRIEALDSGADDFLAKPVDTHELLARVRSLVRMKRYTDDLDSAASIIMAMAALIEVRDGNSEGHCHRMANYATALGRALGISQDDVQTLHRGGFLHDIGMLAIPDTILRKTGPLEPDEYELVKSHTIIGESLCGTLRSLQSVRLIVRHHHERLDGSGYPDGLRGDAIPLTAQIIGVVDVFDAVTTQRSYQRTKPTEQALDLLREQVHRGWRSHDLVETFATIVERGKLETFSRGDLF
jgi:putative two-component system response regulator